MSTRYSLTRPNVCDKGTLDNPSETPLQSMHQMQSESQHEEANEQEEAVAQARALAQKARQGKGCVSYSNNTACTHVLRNLLFFDCCPRLTI